MQYIYISICAKLGKIFKASKTKLQNNPQYAKTSVEENLAKFRPDRPTAARCSLNLWPKLRRGVPNFAVAGVLTEQLAAKQDIPRFILDKEAPVS